MAGVPVIATRSGGPEEILVDGASGILVPVKDPGAMVAAIQKMMDEGKRKGVIDEARRSAKEHFSLQSMLASYKAIYGQLLN